MVRKVTSIQIPISFIWASLTSRRPVETQRDSGSSRNQERKYDMKTRVLTLLGASEAEDHGGMCGVLLRIDFVFNIVPATNASSFANQHVVGQPRETHAANTDKRARGDRTRIRERVDCNHAIVAACDKVRAGVVEG